MQDKYRQWISPRNRENVLFFLLTQILFVFLQCTTCRWKLRSNSASSTLIPEYCSTQALSISAWHKRWWKFSEGDKPLRRLVTEGGGRSEHSGDGVTASWYSSSLPISECGWSYTSISIDEDEDSTDGVPERDAKAEYSSGWKLSSSSSSSSPLPDFFARLRTVCLRFRNQLVTFPTSLWKHWIYQLTCQGFKKNSNHIHSNFKGECRTFLNCGRGSLFVQLL